MRKLGIPEVLIPMLRAKMMAEMSTTEFWEQYRKERGGMEIELPSEIKEILDRVSEERKKNEKL